MKRMLIIAAAAISATLCKAEDFPYLSFEMADGTTVQMNAEGLEMHFSDGKLIATDAAQSKEMPLEALSRMFFSSGATAINELEAHWGKAEAYTIEGVRIGEYSDIKEARATLKSGMYVVKENGKTTKIAVR